MKWRQQNRQSAAPPVRRRTSLSDILLTLLALALLLSACASKGGNASLGGSASLGGAAAVPGDTVERYAEAAPSESGSIAIPGYETLRLQADSLEQTVSLTNPPENPCLFVLTLMLEDGTALWTGQGLYPGERFTAITLNKALPAGEYGALLRYDCFAAQDGAPLNGAEIQLTLVVQ